MTANYWPIDALFTGLSVTKREFQILAPNSLPYKFLCATTDALIYAVSPILQYIDQLFMYVVIFLHCTKFSLSIFYFQDCATQFKVMDAAIMRMMMTKTEITMKGYYNGDNQDHKAIIAMSSPVLLKVYDVGLWDLPCTTNFYRTLYSIILLVDRFSSTRCTGELILKGISACQLPYNIKFTMFDTQSIICIP